MPNSKLCVPVCVCVCLCHEVFVFSARSPCAFLRLHVYKRTQDFSGLMFMRIYVCICVYPVQADGFTRPSVQHLAASPVENVDYNDLKQSFALFLFERQWNFSMDHIYK